MKTKSAISIQNLAKAFGDMNALSEINLEISRGEFFGLLGPNGAGKSTLINIVAGLTRHDKGVVKVCGFNVVKAYAKARLSLGVVPQEIVYDPFFSLREMLGIQSGYFGIKNNKAWIDEILAELRLSDVADKNMRALSGGMKRRALIAQAIVHKPAVIILDEPTAGVDVEIRRSLWTFIKKLHQNGHTVLLTTHYLEEAEELCDRIAILSSGKLIATEEKETLMSQAQSKTLSIGITTASTITSTPSEIEKTILNRSGNYFEIEINKSKNDIFRTFQILDEHGIKIVDLKTSTKDLEDVFLKMIEEKNVADKSDILK